MIFIFDGKPPILKSKEIIKRRELREKATREWIEALKKKDYAKAFSKAIVSSRLSKEMIEDSKKLLNFMGIPYIQAPGEAEAQAAYLANIGEVNAVESKDYDSLLFGTPKLVRFLTLTGKEFLPSKGIFRRIYPEIIELEKIKEKLGITREQLIDIAILIGTDFNEGVYGIGPKKALKLIKEYGKIENLPDNIRNKVDENFNEIRKIFLNPEINKQYKVELGFFQEDEIYNFLCNEKGFNEKRVKIAIDRLKKYHEKKFQEKLEKWI
jgi:flap endonuclease-1